MNKLILTCFVLLLAGCSGSAKFDASSEDSVKNSANKIIESLPETNRKEFIEALSFFSIGGESRLEAKKEPFFADQPIDIINDLMLLTNLKDLDGLTGEQILEKYRQIIEQEKQEIKKILDGLLKD